MATKLDSQKGLCHAPRPTCCCQPLRRWLWAGGSSRLIFLQGPTDYTLSPSCLPQTLNFCDFSAKQFRSQSNVTLEGFYRLSVFPIRTICTFWNQGLWKPQEIRLNGLQSSKWTNHEFLQVETGNLKIWRVTLQSHPACSRFSSFESPILTTRIPAALAFTDRDCPTR